MNVSCALLPVFLMFVQVERQDPPLTEKQREELMRLTQATVRRSAELKTQLDEKQQELAKRYAEFQLDETAVKKLHREITDLQGELLANYHRLQVELRAIVGPDRFVTLRQRLDRVLGIAPPKDKTRKQ
jgi:hypothetical protein